MSEKRPLTRAEQVRQRRTERAAKELQQAANRPPTRRGRTALQQDSNIIFL